MTYESHKVVHRLLILHIRTCMYEALFPVYVRVYVLCTYCNMYVCMHYMYMYYAHTTYVCMYACTCTLL